MSSELLLDPVNNDKFVYKLTGDSFMLYSKGKNGIDDGGVRKTVDDKDDDLYWPLKLSDPDEL